MIKNIIYSCIYYSGVFSLWLYFNRKKVNILMLHGVVDDASKTWLPMWRRDYSSRLDSRMARLSRHYDFVDLDQAVEILKGNVVPKRNTMVVTFDDGYRNNIDIAAPILKKYNIPSTIFIATAYITQQKPFIIDRLDYALQSLKSGIHEFVVDGHKIEVDATSRESLARFYDHYRKKFCTRFDNDMSANENMEKFAQLLEEKTGKSINDLFKGDTWSDVLEWECIEKSASDLVGFESHTVDHYRLANLEYSEVIEQLKNSRDEIKAKIGKTSEFICYPVGSYDDDVIRASKECGYKAGVTTKPGLNEAGCDLFTLKRMPFPGGGSEIANLIYLSGMTL